MWLITKVSIIVSIIILLAINFGLLSSLKVLFKSSHLIDIVYILFLSGVIIIFGETTVYLLKRYFLSKLEINITYYPLLVIIISSIMAFLIMYKISKVLTET